MDADEDLVHELPVERRKRRVRLRRERKVERDPLESGGESGVHEDLEDALVRAAGRVGDLVRGEVGRVEGEEEGAQVRAGREPQLVPVAFKICEVGVQFMDR